MPLPAVQRGGVRRLGQVRRDPRSQQLFRDVAPAAGPARYSADYYLERRYSWWWKLAEVRRLALPLAAAPAVPGDTAAGQPHAA
jgi:hypothetical protein